MLFQRNCRIVEKSVGGQMFLELINETNVSLCRYAQPIPVAMRFKA
jgi:hypothetical protein